jgi:hypothetical protein
LHNVQLAAGEAIVVEGIPDGSETAALDYAEIVPVATSKR